MPCPSWVTEASTTLDVTAVLIAIASVLTASEFLALRGEFRRFGLFDPQVRSSTRPSVLTRRLALVSMPRVAGTQLGSAVTVILFLVFDVSPSLPLVALSAKIVTAPSRPPVDTGTCTSRVAVP